MDQNTPAAPGASVCSKSQRYGCPEIEQVAV